jgi:hypothetical protein
MNTYLAAFSAFDGRLLQACSDIISWELKILAKRNGHFTGKLYKFSVLFQKAVSFASCFSRKGIRSCERVMTATATALLRAVNHERNDLRGPPPPCVTHCNQEPALDSISGRHVLLNEIFPVSMVGCLPNARPELPKGTTSYCFIPSIRQS